MFMGKMKDLETWNEGIQLQILGFSLLMFAIGLFYQM